MTIVIGAQSALAPIAVGLRPPLNGVFFSANMAPDIFWTRTSRATHWNVPIRTRNSKEFQENPTLLLKDKQGRIEQIPKISKFVDADPSAPSSLRFLIKRIETVITVMPIRSSALTTVS
jgi:hypothetical protein